MVRTARDLIDHEQYRRMGERSEQSWHHEIKCYINTIPRVLRFNAFVALNIPQAGQYKAHWTLYVFTNLFSVLHVGRCQSRGTQLEFAL